MRTLGLSDPHRRAVACGIRRPDDGAGQSGQVVPATLRPTPAPSPSGVAGARRIPSGGPIEPGRYYIEKGTWTPATFSFRMPAGWVSENFGQTVAKNPELEGRGLGWGPAIVDQLFADPCGPNDTIDVGPSAEDLAEALAALPGVQLVDTADIILGGRQGDVL